MTGNALAYQKEWFPDSPEHGKNYSMVADAGQWRMANNPHLGMETRLIAASLARGNVWGHASFPKPAELRKILHDTKGRPAKWDTVRRAMEKLTAQKIISPHSTQKCVVLASDMFQRGDRRMLTCVEHEGHEMHKWVRGVGWESEPGAWHGQLRTDAAAAWKLVEQDGGTVTLEREIIDRTEHIERERITVTAPPKGGDRDACWRRNCNRPAMAPGEMCFECNTESEARRALAREHQARQASGPVIAPVIAVRLCLEPGCDHAPMIGHDYCSGCYDEQRMAELEQGRARWARLKVIPADPDDLDELAS